MLTRFRDFGDDRVQVHLVFQSLQSPVSWNTKTPVLYSKLSSYKKSSVYLFRPLVKKMDHLTGIKLVIKATTVNP